MVSDGGSGRHCMAAHGHGPRPFMRPKDSDGQNPDGVKERPMDYSKKKNVQWLPVNKTER